MSNKLIYCPNHNNYDKVCYECESERTQRIEEIARKMAKEGTTFSLREKKEKMTEQEPKQRRYLPTLSELLDRLTILQLKEVKIPEHKQSYAEEIKDCLYDINLIIEQENPKIDAEFLRALVVVAQFNNHIWNNEANFRKGIKEGNNLELTHSLNGIRNRAKNKLQESLNGRKDYKTDCLAAEHSDWEPSW
jgi:hypothetical protein